jgi:N utilization substance protein B
MRIAVYEMLYEEEIPQSVAINEAVELTKRYCDEEAKGFVNAVLGKVAKAIEK